MLSGVGQLFAETQDLDADSILGQNVFFPGQFVDFNYEGQAEVKKAKAWVAGKRKVVASATGAEEYELTLSFEYLDWMHMGFAYDEIPQQSSNVTLPILKKGRVPTSAPYKITDADITPATASSVKAYVSERGSWGEAGFRKVVALSPPGAGEFFVDTASSAHDVIFHSSDAGAPVQYIVNKSYATIESIGHEVVADSFGTLSFIGDGYGPEFPKRVRLYLPNITRISIPKLNTDNVPKFEIKFTANVPASDRSPHKIYNLATAT